MTGDEFAGSTGRLLVASAPGGLCVVQDLLNTASMPAASLPDLLAGEDSAQKWLAASLRTWAQQTGRIGPSIRIAGDDLAALSDLRGLVRSWLTKDAEGRTPWPLDAEISFHDGHIGYGPRGDGAAAVASLVLLETLLASHTGALSRLKACLNPACGAAFYDLSRNSARVWHDMKTCGNTMNLRASRARRRESPTPA